MLNKKKIRFSFFWLSRTVSYLSRSLNTSRNIVKLKKKNDRSNICLLQIKVALITNNFNLFRNKLCNPLISESFYFSILFTDRKRATKIKIYNYCWNFFCQKKNSINKYIFLLYNNLAQRITAIYDTAQKCV